MWVNSGRVAFKNNMNGIFYVGEQCSVAFALQCRRVDRVVLPDFFRVKELNIIKTIFEYIKLTISHNPSTPNYFWFFFNI